MPIEEAGLMAAIDKGVAEANVDNRVAGFGARRDGTPKGEGWLGILKRPDGRISTEISAGYNIGGTEMDVPLLVPTLSADEVRHLLSLDEADPEFFRKLMPSIQQKALEHAKARLAAGQSVYATRQ